MRPRRTGAPERSRGEVERIISFCMHRWQGDANAVHAAEELVSAEN